MLKKLHIVFLLCSVSAYGQTHQDVGSPTRELLGDIILSYKGSGVKKIKIKQIGKFGSQTPVKTDFHYTFENDSVISHYFSMSFLLVPVIGGYFSTNRNWFYDKSESVKYIIKGKEFEYISTKEDSLYNLPYIYWFHTERDSANVKFTDYYKATSTDTFLICSYIKTFDTQMRETSFIVKWHGPEKNYHKHETIYRNDTVVTKYYGHKNDLWELNSCDSVVVTRQKKDNELIITQQNLKLDKEDRSDYTITIISYDKKGRISNIYIVQTILHHDENFKTTIEKETLKVTIIE